MISNNRNDQRNQTIKDFFSKPSIIDESDYYSLINGEIRRPDYEEGEVVLKIVEVRSEEMYGKYTGSIKVEVIFKDDKDRILSQMFILNNGKNNNFAKFIYQAIDEEPQDDFKVKNLVGKEIVATISHYYNEVGIGYANVAFCRPA